MIPRRLARAPALAHLRSRTATRLASTSRKPAPSNTSSTGDRDPQKRKNLRLVVLTGAVALITAVGAATGASLKADRDAAKRHEKARELSIDDRIAILEDRRAGLVTRKIPLERKLADVRARMAPAGREAEEQKRRE